MPKWYRVSKASRGEADISLFSDIGYGGLTARNFRSELAALGRIESKARNQF
jgi:hypothetical protein